MAASSLSNFFSVSAASTSPPVKSLSPYLSLSPIQSSRRPPELTPLRTTHKPNAVISMSAAFPSLANANLMFFKSAYNVQVIVGEDESEEKLLGRFKREVMKAGIIQECKRRRFFETKQEERKRRARDAAKRNRRRRPQERTASQNKQEGTSKTKKEQHQDEDNWELPEENGTSY